MIKALKNTLYFPIAWYFRFFAQMKLNRWKPRVIVVTGSNGKTTTMALVESQLKGLAYYSHHANSSYGIPFNILGLERKTLKLSEWVAIFLLTPFKAFSSFPDQKIYVAEADCDRPGEGTFLASMLKPEVTIWLSTSRTHSMNFDDFVAAGLFNTVEEAIAYEYGYFLENTSRTVIINSDSELIARQLDRTNAEVVKIEDKDLKDYDVSREGTTYKIGGTSYKFKFLLPQATFASIASAVKIAEYFNVPIDDSFDGFELPPGRSSIFKGIKNTIIVDSTYNTGFAAMKEIISMFSKLKGDKKWIVIGDILEQGLEEQEEHEKLAGEILKLDLDKIILIGPRVLRYTKPILESSGKKNVVGFENPKEVLDYILENLKGHEMILFKGARFLEGVIANLLEDKSDIAKLPRREKAWEERRKKWGL